MITTAFLFMGDGGEMRKCARNFSELCNEVVHDCNFIT